MRKFKIMPDDMKTDDNLFGLNNLQDKLKEFCMEQGLEMPQFWNIKSDEYYMGYAASMHLNGKDRWEEFDTMAIFLLRDFSQKENREVEERLLKGTICSMVFVPCRQFVTLIIPRSVRLIGDFVFGPGGGKILIIN